jgi:hypothetical protein
VKAKKRHMCEWCHCERTGEFPDDVRGQKPRPLRLCAVHAKLGEVVVEASILFRTGLLSHEDVDEVIRLVADASRRAAWNPHLSGGGSAA